MSAQKFDKSCLRKAVAQILCFNPLCGAYDSSLTTEYRKFRRLVQ